MLIAGADPQGRKTRTDLQGLNVIYRGTQDGINATPLEAVTEMQVNPRIISIQHREGQRVNTIGANLRSDVIADTVAADLEAVMEENEYRLPASYRMEFEGAFARRSESVADLAINATRPSNIATINITMPMPSERSGESGIYQPIHRPTSAGVIQDTSATARMLLIKSFTTKGQSTCDVKAQLIR